MSIFALNHLYGAVSQSFQRRLYSSNAPPSRILCIPRGSKIFAFGTPSETKTPLLKDFSWSIEQGETWAVVSGSGGGKSVVFKVRILT